MRRSLLAAAMVLVAATAASAAADGLQPIVIRAIPIPSFVAGSSQTRFGALEFRGGLQLVSRETAFGGLSGLDFAPDGRTLYSVADTGYWFRATVVENNGTLTGLSDAEYGPLLLDNGEPPSRKIDADAEGLRITERDGVPTALVSFEQTPTVRAYAGPDIGGATPTRVPLPAFVRNIRANLGLESIAVAPAASALDGAVIVIAERSLDRYGNHRGFIITGPHAGQFTIRRTASYDISDAAFLPDGDLLILERKFSFEAGFAVRMRRIAGASIQPGALLDGPVLIEADAHDEIDNLEGLAVRTTAAGETILTLVSDDNDNLFQRTLLLQFALTAPAPPRLPSKS